MKKILFVIVAVFTVLVFKPTTAANATSTTNEAVESSILNTTQEEMEIISGNRMLLPSMNAVTIVPPMSATSKTSSQNIYKNTQLRHLDVVNAQIHLQKEIQQHHYKIISQAVNYYIFFLRRIRV